MHRYVVFYDLDHTIIAKSSGTLIVKDLYQRGILPFSSLIKGMLLSTCYRIGIINTESLIKKWVYKLKGMDASTIEHYSEIFFEQTVKNYIYPQALESIQNHLAQGAVIVLLSASLDFICNPVQRYLQFHHVLCTQLQVVDGKYNGLIKEAYCYGKAKLEKALTFCKKHNFEMTSAHYYADSFADIPVLEAVGHPHCVNPHPALLRVARANGWTVHKWSINV